MFLRAAATIFLGVSGIGAAEAFELDAGVYLCTVDQRAGIGATHLEDAAPPTAFLDPKPTVKFRIEIARGPGFTIKELPYDGPGASQMAWHPPNAVLHSIYRGDGRDFSAAEDQAFLRVGKDRRPGVIWFWHAGFEYPGGEDTNLSVRTGACSRESWLP